MKYPEITVGLVGSDGNAFAVVGAVRRALHAHGVSKEKVTEFVDEAMSGDYEHLLATVMETVNVI